MYRASEYNTAMQITFLGGAGGVGATCQSVVYGDRALVVDAGVRMTTTGDRLPDLAGIDVARTAAVLLTHAHADHIGALPLVHQLVPAAPIYASPATIRLIEVMLADALRVMARRAADELELPLYDEALVAATLRMLRPLAPGAQTIPALPGLTVHAHRAGHIAGAVSLGLESADGRLVISGDVSVTPQRTVAGAATPAPRYPDLLVLESTYGARAHPNRAQEEQRLAEAVAEVVAGGGHCLIPAFALGRAQELILILRAAQRDGIIPPFPIYVDGLVRAVCAAYAAIPEALATPLRNHLLRGGRPFFGGTATAVESPQQREKVLAGPPACIIASSGMLTGGPSAWYAERLAPDPRAAILITGYQDEEAPGRALLALADTTTPGTLMLGGKAVTVRCRVARYGLSAHADGQELAALVRALQPRAVALVHGDPEARAALAAQLQSITEVILPRDGQLLQLAPGERGGRRVLAPAPAAHSAEPLAVGAGAPLDTAGIERLWAALRDGSGVQSLGVRELARAWFGAAAGAAEEQQVEAALEAGTPFFLPLPGAPGLWRLPAPTEVRRLQAAGASSQPRGPRIDSAGIQAIIDRHLAGAPDLYRRSVDSGTGAVTLSYFFPDVASARDAEAIRRIAAETGAPVTVSPQPHQGMLADAARAAVPTGLTIERAPAIRLDAHTVELRCTGDATPDELADAQARFAEQTGWRLAIGLPGSAPAPARAENDVIEPPAGLPPMEVNAAQRVARTLLAGPDGCYKVGADAASCTLVLRCHFPDVVRTQRATALAELARLTGWRVQVWPQPHQASLLDAARAAAEQAGLRLAGTLALRADQRVAEVALREPAPPAAVASAAAAFERRTGWRLVVSQRG